MKTCIENIFSLPSVLDYHSLERNIGKEVVKHFLFVSSFQKSFENKKQFPTMQVFVVFPSGAYHPLRIYLNCLNTYMLVGNKSALPSNHRKHAHVSALSSAADKKHVDSVEILSK